MPNFHFACPFVSHRYDISTCLNNLIWNNNLQKLQKVCVEEQFTKIFYLEQIVVKKLFTIINLRKTAAVNWQIWEKMSRTTIFEKLTTTTICKIWEEGKMKSNNQLKRRLSWFLRYLSGTTICKNMLLRTSICKKNDPQGQFPKMIIKRTNVIFPLFTWSGFSSIFDVFLVSLFFRLRDYLLTMFMSPSQLVQRHK